MEPLPLFGAREAGVRRVSLVRLSAEIARAATDIGRVAVEGEVVRPVTHPGGTYFTLRDRSAQIAVRCPASRLARCRTVAGERVLVTGSLTWLNDRGQLQLSAEEVVPVGEGAIAAFLADVRARLAAEGLLDRPRRALPRLPRAIGVVCGNEAAVRADIESVVAARFPGYPVRFAETAVSGPGAADAVVGALRALDNCPEVDVVILARGGGDAAQLLPFSDEALCRAICECATPVVSAIGHHGDRPLCDEVADLRCGTPSLAAAAVVPDRDALEAELAELVARADAAVRRHLERATSRLAVIEPRRALRSGLDVASGRLERAEARLVLLHPRRALAGEQERLARVDWRAPVRRRVETERDRLHASRRHLDALDPAAVLARGYAVVRSADGRVLRDPASVAPGDMLDVRLASGRLGARVEDIGR